MLGRSENSSERFYSLSAQIQIERKGYYAILEKSQKGTLDVTAWIHWFFNCLTRAIEKSLSALDQVIRKAQFWKSLAPLSLNERQSKMIHLMLEGFEGNLTSSKWAKITYSSQDTAHRDILELVAQAILIQNPGGARATSYSPVIRE